MRLKNHVVSLVLVVLSLLLAVYLFVFDRSATTSETLARAHHVFPQFRRADLSSIDVSNDDDEFRLLAHGHGADDIVYDLVSLRPAQPSEPADMGAVSALLRELELSVRERTIDGSAGPVDLHALGLDSPRLRVGLSMGPVHYRLVVGAKAPSPAGAAYAMLDGERFPFVVRRDFLALIEQPRERYRIKTFVPHLASELSDWTIAGLGPTRHLRRPFGSPLGAFRVDTPQGWVRVERSAAERMVATLADLRAESFVAFDDADRSLAAEPERISLELVPHDTSKPNVKIEVGPSCPGQTGRRLAVRRYPEPRVAGCIPDSVWDALGLPIDRLADLHLFAIHPDEVEELRLRSGDRRLELARTGTSWHMREPTDTTVDADTGNALARRLTEMVAEGFAEPGAAALFAAKGDASLTQVGGAAMGQDAGDAVQVVEVDEPRQRDSVVVKRRDDGAFLTLSRSVAKDLLPNPLAVRSRTVLEIPLTRVRRIHVQLPEIRQILSRSSTGQWTLEEPKGFAADPALANELAELLGGLRADRWIAEAAEAAHGIDAQHGRLEIEAEGADGGVHVERIALGPAALGARYARREGDPAIFLLPAALERTLTTWAIDRAPFLFDLSEAREVRLRRGADGFTFRWPGEDGKERERRPAVVKEGERVNARDTERNLGKQAERLAKLREALSGMLAEAAVHTGPSHKDEGFEHPQLELWFDRKGEVGRTKPLHFVVGTGDVYRGTSVYYVRCEGIDATFAVAQSHIKPLFELE